MTAKMIGFSKKAALIISTLGWLFLLTVPVEQAAAQSRPGQDGQKSQASEKAQASEKSQAGEKSRAGERSAALKYFTDVQLINHNGESMKFYSDLLKDKVVIINAFFTSCTGVCPAMNQTLEKVQEWLGPRLNKDAYIVSISVDPAVDTPSKLKEYAPRFHAKPGWFFITGSRENVELALYKLGQKVEVREDHSTIIIIGNERTGLWKKAMGLARPDALIKVIESVLDDKPVALK